MSSKVLDYSNEEMESGMSGCDWIVPFIFNKKTGKPIIYVNYIEDLIKKYYKKSYKDFMDPKWWTEIKSTKYPPEIPGLNDFYIHKGSTAEFSFINICTDIKYIISRIKKSISWFCYVYNRSPRYIFIPKFLHDESSWQKIYNMLSETYRDNMKIDTICIVKGNDKIVPFSKDGEIIIHNSLYNVNGEVDEDIIE